MRILAQSEAIRWTWETSAASWTVLVATGIAALVSLWLLRWRLRQGGGTVLTVRVLILGLIAVGCLGWVEQQRETEPPRIAVVVDLSASMAFAARDTDATESEIAEVSSLGSTSSESPKPTWEETRLGDVLKRIGNEQKWLAELQERRHLDWLSLGDRLRTQSDGRALLREAKSPRQESSRLVDGIAELLQQLEGRSYSGVILVTDGVDTVGESWIRLEEQLRRAEVPWYPIRVGQTGSLDRVTIEVEPHATAALVGETLIISSLLRSTVEGRSQVTVALRDETSGQTLTTQNWNRARSTSQRLVWDVPLRRPGPQRYSIHVLNDSGVALATPATLSIDAIRHRAKVLIVSAEPCYEFRYLKHALERARVDAEGEELAFSVSSWLQSADLEYVPTDPSAITRMPSDPQSLAEFDVIVLVDPATTAQDPTRGLSTEELETLRNYVEQDGGNLFLVAGPLAGKTPWLNTPLEPLLPCESSQFLERLADANRITTLPLEPTEVGLGLAPLRGLDPNRSDVADSTDASSDSSTIPLRVTRILSPLSLRPTTRPLLVTPSEDSNATSQGIVAATWQSLGRGSVVFQGFDEAYLLRRRTSDEEAARYWVQWVHHLARRRHLEDYPSVRVGIEPDSPRAGQAIHFRVSSGTRDALPAQLLLQLPSNEVQTINLQERENELGWSDGKTMVNDAGTYVVSWTDRATGETRALRFEVQAARNESDPQPANHGFLEFLADASGGEVQSAEWFGNLPQEISDQALATDRIVSTNPIWKLPLPLFLFGVSIISLLMIEWWLRKP